MSKFFLILIQIIPYFGYVWASLFFFQKKIQRNLNQFVIRIAGLLTIAMNIVLTFFDRDRIVSLQIAGVFFLFISSVLFYWAIFTNRRRPPSFAFSHIEKEELVTSGPYRFIRHPLYSSYIIGWMGGIFINQSWILVPTSAILIFQYFRSSSIEERGFLDGPVSGKYAAYQLSTGRFFPKLLRFKK